VTNQLKACKLLCDDVDYVAGLCPLVAAHWLCRLQVLEPAKAQGLEHPTNGGKRLRQHPGDAAKVAALIAYVNGALQWQWIERPPLSAANTAPIHQIRDTA